MLRLLPVALLAAVGWLVAATPPAAAAEPRIVFHPNGSATARYPDGCVVTYNRELDRSGSQRCRPGQVERADRAYRARLRTRREANIRMYRQPNGAAVVRFDDGCRVTYNREGDRSGSSGCSAAQVRLADRHYRRNR